MGWVRGLRGSYQEILTSASYLFLPLWAVQSGEQSAWFIGLGGVAGIGGLAWISTHRRARAIADLATSRIGSAAQGYVELVGRASVSPDNLIVSPLNGMACIWYRYTVYSKDNNDRGWREVDSATSEATFEIADRTGSCLVDPDDAEVVGAQRRVSYQGDYKQVEDLLFGGALIYVLGEFSTIGGASSALDAREDVGALLAQWKRDAAGLKRCFDLNGDGAVDLQEWELARRLALRSVEKQHRDIRAASGLNLMRAPANARLFLISSLSAQKLRQRYLLWSFFHLSAFALAVGGLVWLSA